MGTTDVQDADRYGDDLGATFTDGELVGSVFDRRTSGLLTVERGDRSFVQLPGADLSARR